MSRSIALLAVPLTTLLLACGGGASGDDSATNDGGAQAGSSQGAGGKSGAAGGGGAGAGAGGAGAGVGGAPGGQAGAGGGSAGAGAGGAAGGQAGAGGGSAGTGGGSAGTGGGSAGAGAGGAAGGQAGAGGAAGGQAGAGGGSAGGAAGGQAGAGGAAQVPVRMIPGLQSITFYETTGTTQSYTFLVGGPELSAKLPDPLSSGNQDITGTSVEFYDVYYSDKDGGFDADGAYLTISGVFPVALPAGGGLNLAEISLNYAAGSKEFGNYVASFVALGDNAVPGDVSRCIDGDLGTWTTMGNTVGASGRLRLTLGFLSSSGKP